ncbi:MAG: hypothetical protein DRN24_05395 [Thermoplasmata archaeon]|nr:MAG: hypothetical protein DRN24_05395 [Thermoplasmata archaeon]
MEKTWCILIVGVLIIGGINAVGLSIQNMNNSSYGNVSILSDEEDQSMTYCEGAIPIGQTDIIGSLVNLSLAQSFTPKKEILTRVFLYMGKNSTTSYPCVVAIRSNLYGPDLTVAERDPDAFPVYNPEYPTENLSWIEFDFMDIHVNIGGTYYIVIYTANQTDNYYYEGGNGSDMYPYGDAFFSFDDGETWQIIETPEGGADGCFITYGRNNSAPVTPIIKGSTLGIPDVEYYYIVTTFDPDDDDVYYYIDWGDYTNTGWVGPYESGENVTFNHTWNAAGTYTIMVKAKDLYGLESSWPGVLVVVISNPPNQPDRPSGATRGKPGVLYTYSSSVVDPDGDQVYYLFDWDDGTISGWLGPYDSGETVNASHSWSNRGSYSVKVKAKDVYGFESVWSEPLSITMPRSRTINIPPLKYLEQYLQMFPVLKQLLFKLL